MRWPSVRGAARVLALAAGLLALALPLTIMAAQGGASPYQWTTSVAGSSQLHGVVWDGSQFVAFGDGGAVFTSPDGQSWSAAKSGTDMALQAGAWSGKSLVAVGSEGLLLQSADAKAWSVKAHGLPAAASAVAYGQVKAERGLFVAVGPQGLIVTSHNGSTWKHRASGTTQNLNAVAYGDGLFVAVGDAGAILTSADGRQWSPASGASASLQGVAFGDGLYVAVGQNGAIFTSADARAWTAAQAPQGETLTAVTYTGFDFLAVGQGGVILRSTDGQSWSAEQSPVNTWLHGVASSGAGSVVAVGDSGMVVEATTYAIGGYVYTTAPTGVKGVTVSAGGLVNVGPFTATTNASGQYTIVVPGADTYTVSATYPGWTINQAVGWTNPVVLTAGTPSVANANWTVVTYHLNFTLNHTTNAAQATSTTVSATNGTNTFSKVVSVGASANASGFVAVPPGSYTVTPLASGNGVMYIPASQTATVTSAAVTLPQQFVGTNSWSVAGHVLLGPSPGTTPIANVKITATSATYGVTYTTYTDGSGAFSFALGPNGTWLFNETLGGYTFVDAAAAASPQTYGPYGASVTNQDFFGLQVFTLGGHVTLNGVGNLPGVTITLSGGPVAPAPATTNASGLYSFTLLPAGTYTVTPSWTGPGSYTFTPASQSITIGPSNSNVNFDAATPSYTVLGKVYALPNPPPSPPYPTTTPLSGVVITAVLTPGGNTYTATSAADGSFSFTLPGTTSGQVYSFTCAKVGYSFVDGSGASLPFVTALTSNQTGWGFWGIPGYYIQGVVTVGGVGIPNVVVTDATSTKTVHTNASGIYTIAGLPAESYSVTAALAGYSFVTASGGLPAATGTIPPSATNVNFVGTTTYGISGTVWNASSVPPNAVLPGVSITLDNPPTGYAGTNPAITDGSGNYSFPNLPAGTYQLSVSPTVGANTFSFQPTSPASVTITAGPATQNFTGTQLFAVSGTVTGGAAGDNFTITANPGGYQGTTSGGAYSINVPPGTYTLTIAPAAGVTNTYTFSPTSISVVVTTAPVPGQNFTASQTFAVSGHAYLPSSTTGISGVTVTATYGSTTLTATSDGTGLVSFLLPAGSVTFNVSKANFTFTSNPYTTTISGPLSNLIWYGTEAYSISGTVSLQGGGTLGGVTLTANPGGYTTTSAADGTYTIANVPVSVTPYVVTPTLANYGFTPAQSAPITIATGGPNVTGINFTAFPVYTISGQVTGAIGTDAFTITTTPGGYTANTGAGGGAYTITGVPAGTYTLNITTAPGAANTYLYKPASIPGVLVNANVTGQDFTAVQTFAISGFVYKTGTTTPVGTAIPITITDATTPATGFGPFTFNADATTGAFTVLLPVGTWSWNMSLNGYMFTDMVPNPLPHSYPVTGPSTNYVFWAVKLLSIGGKVTVGSASGPGLLGVTITALNTATSQSYTANTLADGTYTTALLPPGPYTVSASLANYQFNGPWSVNLSGTINVTGVNFIATQVFSILGKVLYQNTNPVVGLTLSAGPGLTATTASDGTYTIPNVPSSATPYTVTPAPLAGYIFSPPTAPATVNGSNATGINFTAIPVFSISGTITVGVGGPALPGVTVSAGGSYTALTDSNGHYTIQNVQAGAYTLTPSLAGYGFKPTSLAVTVSTANLINENFTAFKAHSILGKVTLGSVGLAGVTVSAGPGLSASTLTDGTYVIANVPDSATAYTVTPSLAGYLFSPASQPATVNGANATGINFAATQVFNIKGTVTDASSKGVAGVAVSAGAGLSTTTAADGTYTIANVPVSATAYTVTPSKTGYTFSPATRSVTVSSSDVTAVNFTATAIYTISGAVKDGSGNAVKGVTISAGAGLSATTAADGTYTIANVPAGTYTLTPSLSVYTFSPATLSVTVSNANLTNKNFTIIYFAVTASSDKTSGNEPLTVTFSSAVSGGLAPYAYDWNFGDGTADGTTASIVHTFAQTGLYTVQLTVTDANHNAVAANAISIQVGQPPLAVTATSSTTGGPAAPVAASFTAVATGGSGSYTYAWSFGDGGTGTGAAATHTYTTGGTFTATVTVTDSQSHTASDSVSVPVLPPPTIAAVTKMTSPFRLKIMGANFHLNPIVKINGVPVPLSDLKSSALIIAKKGAALKAMVPKGVPVQITVVNTDDHGISAAVTYVR